MQWQNGRISAIVKRSPSVTSFFFDLAQPFAFRAGQHVDVRLTAPDGYRAQRSYSIASAPEAGGGIELAIDRLPDGEVSPFFHEVAEVGDEIELRGPIGGHFVWSVEDGGPVLLIGGGSGVVPLLSMIRHRAAQGATIPMLLLFSVRTSADLLFGEELQALHERADGFQLAVTLTREANAPAGGFTRRIDAAMVTDVLARLPEPPKTVFVCGANAFVAVAADGVIDAGVPAERVKTERYGV
ncbi:MAG: ferredoxin reductase [Mesorhizobium sp.]|nr:ferredoxin reductase [Mesorhizobium sp.]